MNGMLLSGKLRESHGDLRTFNPLNAELNPICYLLSLLELTIFSTLAG